MNEAQLYHDLISIGLPSLISIGIAYGVIKTSIAGIRSDLEELKVAMSKRDAQTNKLQDDMTLISQHIAEERIRSEEASSRMILVEKGLSDVLEAIHNLDKRVMKSEWTTEMINQKAMPGRRVTDP